MISILCPTRGRPGNVHRMVNSALATADDPLEFVFRTDTDDEAAFPENIRALPCVTVIRDARDTLSNLWNDCWAHATAPIFMQADDEVVFRSAHWDTQVVAAFAAIPDRIAFVHGRDGHQPDGTFGTLGFLHERWTRTV